MPSMRREKLIAPPVAIIVFDGMQSHRWAAPPMTSRSISVTLAPSRAAYVAAVLPAGPPPMMTKRMVTPTGYGVRFVVVCPSQVRRVTNSDRPRVAGLDGLRSSPATRFGQYATDS